MQEKEKQKQQILDRYAARTPESRRIFERAKRILPGGDTRSMAHYDPYPFYATKGSGCYLYDCDGNRYIDLVNNMTTLIHGHAHPHIVEAITRQAPEGTCHAAPIEQQVTLAELICDRVDSVDMLRFCNSGTEATLFAMRGARAFTGRDIIVKIDGGYNGSHDAAQINVFPDLSDDALPRTVVPRGIAACVGESILAAPFNDLVAMETILSRNSDRIAGIIMEPMMGAGGGILATDGYLKGVRELADRYGVLLILDEVITLRFNEGGYQAIAGVKPDLTTLGKIIGGGMPVGAFGGRRDIMEIFNPTKPDHVSHSGTLSGNAMTMAAGLACMEIYTQKEVDRLNALGDRIRRDFQDAMQSAGVKGQVSGYGSCILLWFFDQPATNGKEFVKYVAPTMDFSKMMHIELLNRGLYCGCKGFVLMSLSTPMDEEVVDTIVKTFSEALEVVAPLARTE
ncbi:MAG: aspartate aminotransferase family protein [Deltaproteobacteria bacterium]|nr:aspartate aminotransferase family protein [Deltaproteobacteria bacterium]